MRSNARMRAMKLVILAFAACGLGQTRWHATPEQMAPLPPMAPKAETAIGPLALEPGAGQTSWPDIGAARRIAEGHYLDAERIHAETSAFLAFVAAFYQPLTPETKLGFDQVHREMATLERLAPYSMYNVTLAFAQSTERLHLCIEDVGVTASCFRDLKPHAEGPAFEISELAPGIGMLAVHDLRSADDPAWRGFGEAAQGLAAKRGLVIDLRDAVGADPRPLLPWVARLAGKAELRPIRAIERPVAADPYVRAYQTKFTDHGRDPAIWSALVVTAPAATATRQPIEILVGPQCEAACELIARTLETYAGAVVIGGVTKAGRLARDEPALLVLPHSQTSIYFHATRYLLAAEIEAATGPTEEWHALTHGDPVPFPPEVAAKFQPVSDYASFAIRELEYRIAHPAGWPRCDATPTTAPVADTPKLQGASTLQSPRVCDAGYEIVIFSDAPPSVLQRYLATCSPAAELSGFAPGEFFLRAPARPTAALMAQIAASELVTHVTVGCSPRYQLETN